MWHEIKNHTKFIELGEFVVMPNHIHGIIIINKPYDNNTNINDRTVTDIDNNTVTNNNAAFVETHATFLLPIIVYYYFTLCLTTSPSTIKITSSAMFVARSPILSNDLAILKR